MIYLNLVMSIWFFIIVVGTTSTETISILVIRVPALIFGVLTMFLFLNDIGVLK